MSILPVVQPAEFFLRNDEQPDRFHFLTIRLIPPNPGSDFIFAH